MWLLISSESENSRFGEFGGDFGEGGARVFPWEKNSVQFNLKRQEVGLFFLFSLHKICHQAQKGVASIYIPRWIETQRSVSHFAL